MTSQEFQQVLLGDARLRDPKSGERLRYVISREMDLVAKELRKTRPDRAGRLRWISQQVRFGLTLSKGVVDRASKDIREVESRLVTT